MSISKGKVLILYFCLVTFILYVLKSGYLDTKLNLLHLSGKFNLSSKLCILWNALLSLYEMSFYLVLNS